MIIIIYTVGAAAAVLMAVGMIENIVTVIEAIKKIKEGA